MESINKYRIENVKLGSGGFSDVFLGTNLETNEKVAVKKISLTQKKNILEKLKLETELMQKFNHPNVVTYYDVIKTDDYWYIVMEYCNAGTLDDVIKFNENMSKKKSLDFNRELNTYYYLNQLKDALNYIRKQRYIHRDIKPMNILLTRSKNLKSSFLESDTIFKSADNMEINYNFSENLVVKLADFGLARYYKDNEDMSNLNNTICGTPLYMAPEMLLNAQYNSKADLWSYGVIMYQLLFGTHPNRVTSLEHLKNSLRSKPIDFHTHKNFTPHCFDILKKLLTKDYKKRIDWNNFFVHKWFSFWKENNSDKIIFRDLDLSCSSESLFGSNAWQGDGQTEITEIQSEDEQEKYRSGFASISPPNALQLGSSNLSKMRLTSVHRSTSKMAAQNDYPSSYPPLYTKPIPIGVSTNNRTRNYGSNVSKSAESNEYLTSSGSSYLNDSNFSPAVGGPRDAEARLGASGRGAAVWNCEHDSKSGGIPMGQDFSSFADSTSIQQKSRVFQMNQDNSDNYSKGICNSISCGRDKKSEPISIKREGATIRRMLSKEFTPPGINLAPVTQELVFTTMDTVPSAMSVGKSPIMYFPSYCN